MSEGAECRSPSGLCNTDFPRYRTYLRFTLSNNHLNKISVAISRLLIVSMLLLGPSSVTADEWSDAGFTSLHRVVWQEAGFTFREAKRWKNRCGITDPKQVAEWRHIGLTTSTAVSFWIQKGFTTPAAVVKFRNRELSDQRGRAADQILLIPEVERKMGSKAVTSDRRKREWLRKSQVEELVAHGIDSAIAEEWIYAGYSSDETKEWLKLEKIELPDDVSIWRDIGIDSPEALSSWYSKGLTTAAEVQKQMAFEKGEQVKFARLNVSPEMIAEWRKIGATTSRQVSYLINRGYSIDELQDWLAAGFRYLTVIDGWRATGIGAKESGRWRSSGFGADEVTHLMASDFSLEEIKGWEETFGPFVSSKERINSWRDAGFSVASAKRWNAEHRGISEATAATWRDNGYEPESEWVLLETTPEVIEQWRNSGQTPTEVLLWIKSGFDEPTAQNWIAQGLNARQAKRWRDHQYTPAVAQLWIGQGVNSPGRAEQLKEITIDVSTHFVKGVTYNAFRRTAKLLGIHKLPATSKLGAKTERQRKSVLHFDTLTPFAKCMTAYANKTALSASAIRDIEQAYFNQIKIEDRDGRRFMGQYRNRCQDWTLYIFSIWLYASK